MSSCRGDALSGGPGGAAKRAHLSSSIVDIIWLALAAAASNAVAWPGRRQWRGDAGGIFAFM